MRVLYILSAAFVALVVSAPAAPCQGLAAAAAKERDRRKNLKPAKVITEVELRTVGGTVSQPGGAVDPTAKPAEPAKPADGSKPGDPAAKPAEGGDKGKDGAKKEPTEEEIRADKSKDWRERLDKAQAEVVRLSDEVEKARLAAADMSGGVNTPARAGRLNRLDEAQKLQAAANQTVADLQEEGRRNGFR